MSQIANDDATERLDVLERGVAPQPDAGTECAHQALCKVTTVWERGLWYRAAVVTIKRAVYKR